MTDGQSEACAANGPHADPHREKAMAFLFRYFCAVELSVDEDFAGKKTDPKSPQEMVDELAALIRDAERWREMRWRKCDEEMPKDNEMVLVLTRQFRLGFWRIQLNRPYKPCWLCPFLNSPLYPTHWMPLPQPPEEE